MSGDEEWEPDATWNDPGAGGSETVFDPPRMFVGVIVGIAGVLLLLQPVVRSLRLFGSEVPLFILSVGVLSLGLSLGTLLYFLRGDRLVWIAHAIGAVGFGFLFVAAGFGNLVLLWAGLAVVLGGVLFLAVQSRDL